MKYAQCRLVRHDIHGKTTTVSYLPEKYCKVGCIVNIKNAGVYIVEFVGNLIDEKYLPDYHNDSKGLWKATSGDEPKGHK